MRLSRRQFVTLAGGAAFASACSGSSSSAPTSASTTAAGTSTSTSTSTTEAATTTTEPPTTTTAVPRPVQPLTGLPLRDARLLTKVALIVKVSNDRKARPQTGLNDADIVFEAWGAGPTRFATVWHSRDKDFVGPIRSCREQDVNLCGEFNRAVFACSGGNPGNNRLIQNSDMMLITEGRGPGWELDPTRSRPHKTHANTALLRSNAGPDRTGPKQQFHYRAEGEHATAGEKMSGFDLQIEAVFVQWRYDARTRTYLRSQDGGPHLLADGAQVSTNNVVVVWLDYYPSHTDNRSPDGRSTGKGLMVAFTGGRLVAGTWERHHRVDPFDLRDTDGKPVLLTPGRTFIELPNSARGSFQGHDVFTPVH